MLLGHILQPGDTLQASDLRCFGEDNGKLKHLTYGEGMKLVGSTGGMVTDQHGHFFRPWSGSEDPEVTGLRNALTQLQAQLDVAESEKKTLQAVNAELRTTNREIVSGLRNQIPSQG